MDARLTGMLTSLREDRSALDAEVQPFLQARKPDYWLRGRLHDVADEYAGRARVLRRIMSKAGAEADDPDALAEVDRLCTHFVRTAALIAQETRAGEVDPSLA